MKLLTEVSLPGYPFQVDHQTPLLFMGSCFTENIGRLMERYLFPVCINPFGTTYNPVSVMTGLDALLHKERYVAEDLEQMNDLWFSFDHYTGFSSTHKKECLENINGAFLRARQVLGEAKLLVLTWGTAWVYRYNPSGQVVCNCHKIPASQFTRTRLTTKEIIQTYETLLPQIFQYNPDVKILLTVSPVRHWKDGARGNQLSKASLLLASEALETLFPDQVFYFPSYEIVMDELRDYRYYAGDMLHMNQVATSYIWEKFSEAMISETSLQIMLELEPLLKMMGHRQQEPSGELARKTAVKKEELYGAMEKKYPFLAWGQLGIKDAIS